MPVRYERYIKMAFTVREYLIAACLLIVLGCTNSGNEEFDMLPDYVEGIENLKIIDDHEHQVPSHKLKKVAVYESNEDIFIGGYISNLAIDKDERVYLDDVFIIRSQSLSIYSDSDYPYVLFNQVTDDGIILPDEILQSERFKLYFPANEGSDLPFPMPFTRSYLVSMSSDSIIYGAWSDKFLIDKYDLNGSHIESWYFPIDNNTMNLRDLELSQYRENTLNRYNDIPGTWPVLHKMSVDYTGRLWISTITESDSTYTWYVLNNEAEIESTFIHSGSRSSRSAMTDYIFEVKNDFAYLQERDIQEGIERIVKYQLFYIY